MGLATTTTSLEARLRKIAQARESAKQRVAPSPLAREQRVLAMLAAGHPRVVELVNLAIQRRELAEAAAAAAMSSAGLF